MDDAAPVVPMGKNSPEEVALKLFELVSSVERKLFFFMASEDLNGRTVADRNYILDTFAACLSTVKGERPMTVGSSV